MFNCVAVLIFKLRWAPDETLVFHLLVQIAVFVSSSDAAQPGWLLNFLRSISRAQISEMRQNLAKVRDFEWSDSFFSFHYILLNLVRRIWCILHFWVWLCFEFDPLFFFFSFLIWLSWPCYNNFLSTQGILSTPVQHNHWVQKTWCGEWYVFLYLCVVLPYNFFSRTGWEIWECVCISRVGLELWFTNVCAVDCVQMAGKLVNIKLHTRRSQRVVKDSRSICTCDCRRANLTSSSPFL